MNRFFCLISACLLTTGLLAGCGGSSGGSSSYSGSTDSSVTGTVVDPYLYQAVFDEVDPDSGEVRQTSEPSTKSGAITFSKPLTAGSILEMQTTENVFHVTPGGTVLPYYDGPLLTRRVSEQLAAGSEAVTVTPITTLADQLHRQAEAEGETPNEDQIRQQIAEKLQVNNEDVFADPVAAMENGDAGLLQASLAVNMAMGKQVDLDTDSSDFNETLDQGLQIAKRAIEDENASDEDIALAAAAASHYHKKAAAGDEVEAATDKDQLKQDLQDAGVNTSDFSQDDFKKAYNDAVDKLDHVSSIYALLDNQEKTLNLAENFRQAQRIMRWNEAAKGDISISEQQQNVINFFYAFSRVALLAKPASDGNPDNGLNRLGDILDQLQVKTGNAREANWGLQNTIDMANLPSDTSIEARKLQLFLYQRGNTALQGALDSLNEVSQNFNFVTETDTEFDNSDVQLLQAYGHFALSAINLQQGLKMDADLAQIANKNLATIYDVLAEINQNYPELLSTKNSAALEKAQSYAQSALNGLKKTIDAVQAEQDSQSNDFMSLYGTASQEETEATKAQIDKALAVINEGADAELTFDTKSGPQTAVVDLSPFFLGDADLNNQLPSNNDGSVAFPDPTFGGMVNSDYDVNTDKFNDGVPDVLQGNSISKYTPEMLEDKFFSYDCYGDFNNDGSNDRDIGAYQFRADGSQEGYFRTDYGMDGTDKADSFAGTWKIQKQGAELALDFDDDYSTTHHFQEAEATSNGIKIEADSNDGTGSYPITLQEQKQNYQNFTEDIVSGSTLTNALFPSSYITFNSDKTYDGYMKGNNIKGVWSMESGNIKLTNCSKCPGDYTLYKLEQGYINQYSSGDFRVTVESYNTDDNMLDGFPKTFPYNYSNP